MFFFFDLKKEKEMIYFFFWGVGGGGSPSMRLVWKISVIPMLLPPMDMQNPFFLLIFLIFILFSFLNLSCVLFS